MKKLLTLAAVALISTSAFALDNTTTTTKSKTTSTTMSQADQDKWWHDRDVNNDGKLSKDEYVNAETKDGSKTKAEAEDEFAKKDKDGDGYINASEFKAWFEKMGDKVQSGEKKVTGKTTSTNMNTNTTK